MREKMSLHISLNCVSFGLHAKFELPGRSRSCVSMVEEKKKKEKLLVLRATLASAQS